MHNDNPTLQQCRALLQTLYAERLKALVLYGSCARGTEGVESDIDLMVLLEGPVDLAQEIRRIWAVLYPIQLGADSCHFPYAKISGVWSPSIAALRKRPIDSAYSITLVACTNIELGTLRPSALAVFILTTRSNTIGCSIGKSAGFAPLRILST